MACILLASGLWAGCQGGSGSDAGPTGEGADSGPAGDAADTATRIELWAQLPGVTATIEGASTVLDDAGGVVVVEPGIHGTRTTVRLEEAGLVVELPADWSLDYEASHLAPDTWLEQITMRVIARDDGECGLSPTNGLAGGRAFAGDTASPIAPCGPFR